MFDFSLVTVTPLSFMCLAGLEETFNCRGGKGAIYETHSLSYIYHSVPGKTRPLTRSSLLGFESVLFYFNLGENDIHWSLFAPLFSSEEVIQYSSFVKIIGRSQQNLQCQWKNFTLFLFCLHEQCSVLIWKTEDKSERHVRVSDKSESQQTETISFSEKEKRSLKD